MLLPLVLHAAAAPASTGLCTAACGSGAAAWGFATPHLCWNGTLCLTSAPHPQPGSLLSLSRATTSPTQRWELGSGQLRNPAANMCATAKGAASGVARPGDPIDIWGCVDKPNEKFELVSGELVMPAVTPTKLCVAPCAAPPPPGPPPPPPPPPGPIVVRLGAPGRRWDGLGGLSAGASSRLA